MPEPWWTDYIIEKALWTDADFVRHLTRGLRSTRQVNGGVTAVIEIAGRIRHRRVCDNRRDRRLRGARGECAETLDDNSDNDRQTARRKFAQETADCDSAFRRRSLGQYKLAAIQLRELKSSDDRRETGREYAPARAAMSDRFRPDIRIAADLAK